MKCAISKKCGACSYIDMPYPQQLELKQAAITERFSKYCPVEPIIGMDDPFYYRNKVHAALCRSKSGTTVAGIYAPGTHDVLPIEGCFLEDVRASAIINTTARLLAAFKIPVYDEDSTRGLVRHILVRCGHASGQIMLVLVTSSHIFPSRNNLVKAILQKHPEITTIVQNVNDRRTSMVLGTSDIVLHGKGYIQDTLCGKIFRISPQSFYQVNSVQTEKLYACAIDYACISPNSTVIDAYCGIGTVSLVASNYASKVIGVELNKDAVHDAIVNARLNKVTNTLFEIGDAGQYMLKLSGSGASIDTVFMDPPRSGSDETFLQSLIRLSPRSIVYISCCPDTLLRDIKYMISHSDYRPSRLRPVDMFPMTEHVESVVLLTKREK